MYSPVLFQIIRYYFICLAACLREGVDHSGDSRPSVKIWLQILKWEPIQEVTDCNQPSNTATDGNKGKQYNLLKTTYLLQGTRYCIGEYINAVGYMSIRGDCSFGDNTGNIYMLLCVSENYFEF